jgi:hypothetical protein
VTVELTLLSRVAYRGQEITGPRIRGLLALLAGEDGMVVMLPRLLPVTPVATAATRMRAAGFTPVSAWFQGLQLATVIGPASG